MEISKLSLSSAGRTLRSQRIVDLFLISLGISLVDRTFLLRKTLLSVEIEGLSLCMLVIQYDLIGFENTGSQTVGGGATTFLEVRGDLEGAELLLSFLLGLRPRVFPLRFIIDAIYF